MTEQRPRRYTLYLKDGRTPTILGIKIDPNVDRLYQGQLRNFVVVTTGETESAVFLSQDVLGWTVTDDVAAVSDGGYPAPRPAPQPRQQRTSRPAQGDALSAILDS
jgi:hypothetical protein